MRRVASGGTCANTSLVTRSTMRISARPVSRSMENLNSLVGPKPPSSFVNGPNRFCNLPVLGCLFRPESLWALSGGSGA